MTTDTDTIAALATPPGAGGIGIVRITGPRALAIGAEVAGRRLTDRRARYAEFRDTADNVIDQGIALGFVGPRSFTGEDVVELQGHGGAVVMGLLLDTVITRGARLARPGEFTERAFVNGKLDLAQAEAVADLIASASSAAARGAMRSLSGEFSRVVNGIDAAVLELRVYVEAAMDFPEEDQDFFAEGRIDERLADIGDRLEALLRETRQGVLLRDGITVALVGPPNVGKSSLLNRLAGQDRAIVTDLPGTTRDLIHADLSLDGLPVQVVDTAGLRTTLERVEQEGVRRAQQQAAGADVVLLLEEDGVEPGHEDATLAQTRAAVEPDRLVRVRNKIDLTGSAPGRFDEGETTTLHVSALTGAGIEALARAIRDKVGFAGEGTTFTARRRHITALQAAEGALQRASDLTAGAAPPELIAEELRTVHQALGSIVGLVSADELLGEIFASFCIGK